MKTVDLDNQNIQSVICESCGNPISSDPNNDESCKCPDCTKYWIKELIFQHYY